MKSLRLAPLLLLPLCGSALAGERWQQDTRVLNCLPQTLYEGGTLSVKLGPNHGQELSVAREHDNATFLLVVGSPPEGFSSLMSTTELSKAKRLSLPANLKATPWEPPFDKPKVRVFNKTGTYWLFVSSNLESEAGGYRCKIKFVQSRE